MTSMTGDTISAFVGPALGDQERTQPRRGRCRSPRYPIGVSHRAQDDCAWLFADGRARSTGSHGRVPRRHTVDRADRSRSPRAPGTQAARSLVIQLWYPAAAGTRSASYMPPAVARLLASSAGVQPALLEAVKLDATTDAAPLKRKGGWPVVLFSPGFGVERELYAGLVVGPRQPRLRRRRDRPSA